MSLVLSLTSHTLLHLPLDDTAHNLASFFFLSPPVGLITSLLKNVAGSNELLYVNWVLRQLFPGSFVFRQCCCTSRHDHPEESSDSLMGFWLFTETTCRCEEGCKVNLYVFEVRVAPHWLSLYSLITLYISSSQPSLSLFLSLTHTYQCFELWLKLSGVSLFAPLWSVLKG